MDPLLLSLLAGIVGGLSGAVLARLLLPRAVKITRVGGGRFALGDEVSDETGHRWVVESRTIDQAPGRPATLRVDLVEQRQTNHQPDREGA
jgi:hypothetical protein